MQAIRGGMRGIVLGGALAMALASPAEAQEPVERRLEQLQAQVEALQLESAARDTAQIAELRRQIEALSREIERLRLGEAVVDADTSMFGFAPAASKVYRVRQGVSIGGYGEVLYEAFDDEREDGTPVTTPNQFDALRAILYFGYKFNDRILFNSEIEFEHGSTGQGGEASIEFAYIDYLLTPGLGLRGGLLLAPMGLVNELHEPPTFLGTTRPLVESAIIPTTWRANGAGVFAEMSGLSLRAYALTSLDAVGGGSSRASGFGAGGLRGGRQKGAREMANDFSLVGRADYVGIPGVMIGGSGMIGQTAHDRVLNGEEVDATTTILEGHLDLSRGGVDLRGLYAVANVDEATELNALRELSGAASIGERLTGAYVQAGYDVLRALDTAHQLSPYVRWETLNTQDEVPAGFAANPATDRTAWLIGAMWKPIPEVALKADYQLHRNQAETGVSQFNVNLSYLF